MVKCKFNCYVDETPAAVIMCVLEAALRKVRGQLFLESEQVSRSRRVAASVRDLVRQLLQVTPLPGSLLSEVRAQLPDPDGAGGIPCCQEPSLLDVKFQTVHGAVTRGLLQGNGRFLWALLKVKQVHISCKTNIYGSGFLYLTQDVYLLSLELKVVLFKLFPPSMLSWLWRWHHWDSPGLFCCQRPETSFPNSVKSP